jgi:hypothetical protein
MDPAAVHLSVLLDMFAFMPVLLVGQMTPGFGVNRARIRLIRDDN